MARPLVPAAAVIMLITMLPALASGADFRAEALVDRDMVGVGDRLVLTIVITGANEVRDPDLGDLDGFRLDQTSRSQSINMVNFKVTKSLNLQYVLTALKEGEYELGPFAVSTGKEAYVTDPVKVRVVKGQAPQGGRAEARQADDKDLVKVSASVDRTRAYVGQQITHTVKFAYRVRMLSSPEYVPADHTGFWLEELGSTGPEVEVIDGVQYYVIYLRTAYFPISSGDFTIGKSGIRYVVQDTDPFSRDPFSIFGRDPFGRRGREALRETRPIAIEVIPLPEEGRPEDFTGAVGKFDMRVIPSSRVLKTGESLTLSVKISGRGDIKSIRDLAVPEFEDFRVFAPKARESADVKGLRVGGVKTFDLVLVPQRPGKFTLDGFTFSYFDPDLGKYITETADPIEIEVGEGDEALTGIIPGGAGQVGIAHMDIRHIRRDEISGNELRLSVGGAPGLLLRYLPVIIALVGIVVSIRKRRAEVAGKGVVRKALKAAMKDLKAAGVLARDPARAAEAAGMTAKAMKSYLGARMRIGEALVDHKALASITAIPDDVKSRVTDLIGDLDKVRFAPGERGAGEITDLVDSARELIRMVEDKWRD
ncbi:MAG: BatD family protein [bacterium]